MNEMEEQARKLNEADRLLRSAIRIYGEENMTLEDLQDRVEDINDEEQVLTP